MKSNTTLLRVVCGQNQCMSTIRTPHWDRPYYESGTILITVHFRDLDGAERVVIRSVFYAYTKVVASG